ncbi:MAG TPA: hypothetical protein VMR99_00900 [Candidatus Paceibacterota bacterium]|nr:hypothetical protein [Candidatus Paceibacterota bacterium]
MTTITKEQAQNRFALLPPTLQDAVFSVQNAEIIFSVGEQYHLPDDKVEGLASLVGWVLLGFLHLENLPGEIAADEGIAPPLAKDITDSLTNKIFAVIKPDIDKAYAPVPHEEPLTGPVTIQDTDSSPISAAPVNLGPKPITLSDIGWSKSPAERSATGTSVKIPVPQAPTPTSKPTTIPIPTPKAAEPSPMILHEDTTFKPAEKNLNFSLAKPGTANEMTTVSDAQKAAARPAVLEFGTGSSRVPTPPKPPTFQPSLSSLPTTSGGARNLSQIISAVPVPTPKPVPIPIPKPLVPPMNSMPMSAIAPPIPRPPQPPQPPKPPVAPTPTPSAPIVPAANKPIVKDFL